MIRDERGGEMRRKERVEEKKREGILNRVTGEDT